MWVPWARSPTRVHTRIPFSPGFDSDTTSHPPSPPSFPPQGPIHKHNSISFKDIETLLNHHPSPFHSPARPVSLKDVHALLTEGPDPATGPLRKSSIFHRVWAWAHRQAHPPPDGQNRVVVYYTSLRVVRRTFEECRAVRSILKGYKVKIDERDLSMEGAYVGELEKILGKKSDVISLPKVFVNGKYVGGGEEIRRLHENGDLKRLIQGLPLSEVGPCGVCGGYRYMVCEKCDGSRRVYIDDEIGFKCCNNCNENGLIRCPSCISVLF